MAAGEGDEGDLVGRDDRHIPLIWTIPWSMMASAVLYRRIFYANAR